MVDRRTRKRLATRQGISDAATRLFIERGFDHVTVDEIAEAADVGRMTVFNHFPRKEDMFFDRDEEGREALREALRSRTVAPIEALRLLAHRAVGSYVQFAPETLRFAETIEKSPALTARARAIRDEMAQFLADELGGGAEAYFAAQLQLATWTVAFVQGFGAYRESGDADAAARVFLGIVDRGARALETALTGTGLV